ncbi:ThuA domain-containing protein [Phenylobacterium sp.]|uniref:ThuA domain-containing protein n=1 Tax=Phenylobacterium sp. TaxID=1871053 RepID=UPI002ED7713A
MKILRLLGALIALAAPMAVALQARAADAPKVLVFHLATGYRHASIDAGVPALKALGAREKIRVEASDDPNVFNAETLKGYRAIVFLNATTQRQKPESEWLAGERRAALQAFVRGGGGVVGIHAATDSHYGWDWYGRLMGARFARHPPGTPKGSLTVADTRHPALGGLPTRFDRVDEWYYFDDYDPTSRLLVALDPASIGEPDVNPNPISWVRTFEGGRVFYTAMGHTPESFSDPLVLKHIAAGLNWVLRRR